MIEISIIYWFSTMHIIRGSPAGGEEPNDRFPSLLTAGLYIVILTREKQFYGEVQNLIIE